MESQKENGVPREDNAMVMGAEEAVTLDSSPVQESPFSNYLNNLSPIKPIKAANAVQVFLGINSSPLIFSSPTVNLQSRSDQLKRSKMLESSKLEPSDDARKDDLAHTSQKFKEFVTQSGNVSAGFNGEFANFKDSLIYQSGNSSRIMDGFLADLAETDCANSTHLKDFHDDCPKGNSSFDCEGGSTNGSGEESIDMLLVSPEQVNQEAGNLLICSRRPKGSEEYHEAEPSFSVGCEVSMIDSPTGYSKSQMDIGPDADIKEGSHLYASYDPGQPLYDSFINSEANEDHGEGDSDGLIMLADTHHHEEMQHQRFLLRRCLQFDNMLLDVPSKSLGTPSSSMNSSRSLAVVELENLNFSVGNETYLKTPVSKMHMTVKPIIRKTSMTTNITPGIDLHLNSIIDASPTGAGTSNTSDVSTRSAHCVEPENFTEAKGLYVTPLDKRKICLALINAEFIQTSLKRRRKDSNTSVSDGCKRCSCRKSRCLKLYCDCFAAGLLCTEPCACQGCLNKHEEKEAVLAAREQIESRNSLAFAPKIVLSDKGQASTDGENESRSTPSSARHKKGCNCKRSMCQKKYCECYQANVGCSDNCRCERCMNVFGTKEDFLVARELACRSIDEASVERKRNVKLSMAMTYSRDHLMPPTPAFQFSDNRKGLLRSRLATKCSSPNSYSKSGSVAGLTREIQFEGSQESPAFVPPTDLLDPNCGEKAHEFSPQHDSFGSLCHPTLPSTLSAVISETRDSFSTSYPGVSHLPRSSLCRHRSPDNSRQDQEPWSKIYELLSDDTSEVLKDASSPTRRVIVHAPSCKRVSSPQKQINERCSCSSTALKSGGKFILKAVPSFPRLTPSSKSTDKVCKSDGNP